MKKHLRALCQKTKKVEIRKKGKIVLSESQVITGNLCPRHSIDCKASWLLSSSLLKATPPWLLSMEGEGYLCHHIVLMSQCFHPHARSVIFIPLTCLLPAKPAQYRIKSQTWAFTAHLYTTDTRHLLLHGAETNFHHFSFLSHTHTNKLYIQVYFHHSIPS